MKPVRVLVVDDSASMRALIRQTLSADKSILVVGEAANPLEARDAIKKLNPDVMTLDVEMPHMNGIEFLEKVMRLRPLPVIMVSSLTERGAMITIQAMEFGAVDCVAKPTSQNSNSFAMLAEKVKSAAGARMRDPAPIRAEVRSASAPPAPNGRAQAARALGQAGGDRRLDRRRRSAGHGAFAISPRNARPPWSPFICRRRSRAALRSGWTGSARRASMRRRMALRSCPATSMSRRERTPIWRCRARSNCVACCGREIW